MSLRIAVCAKRDLLGALALNELLPRLAPHTVGLFYSNKTRPAERAVPELAVEALLERELPLEVLFPLMERTPGHQGRIATFGELAERHTGGQETVLTDIAVGGGARLLEAFAPDLVISVRFSLIFKAATIASVRHGIINVHPGPLPDYRGLFAAFWQVLHGETRLGVTTHMVDAGIDTGPIIGIDWVPADPDHSVFWHLPQLYCAGVRAGRRCGLAHRRRGAPSDRSAAGRGWRLLRLSDGGRFRALPSRRPSPGVRRRLHQPAS